MKRLTPILALTFLTACAGWERDCNSGVANRFGGDWIVVQHGMDGNPFNCWKLKDTAISNEEHTDGIFWLDGSGHLVHISGWYDRVQVSNGDYAGAAKAIGINLEQCTGGRYVAPKTTMNDLNSPWNYLNPNPRWYAYACNVTNKESPKS